MGRKKLSEYPPDVAARMRAEFSARQRDAWRERERNGFGTRVNGMTRDENREKLSQTLREKWERGDYTNRINGMAGRTGSTHPNWTWGKGHYNAILSQFEPKECFDCGEFESKLDCHHVDENHDNYLLTNFMWQCVPCHQRRHAFVRTPFVTLGKSFRFEYAHVLPWHPDQCARLHGHSGELQVKVRGRVDDRGIVFDFHDISSIVKMSVIKDADHQFLNDFIDNPTSENFLVWAWNRLSEAGLKGLTELTFKETDSSSSTLTNVDLYEAYGWDIVDERYVFLPKEV